MLSLPTRAEIDAIAPSLEAIAPRTPQFRWPLLDARAGCEVWVKHENHTAIGSFKLRGALAYVARLREREPNTRGVIAATRGNFGQAVAFAAARHQLSATIVVPRGNNPEKNRAMRALGVELIEEGDDFQAALEHSVVLARQRGLHAIPSFHRDLVLGNAVSALDFLTHTPPLDAVYVPIGLGSGICAMAAARAALGLAARTQLIGVASDAAPGIALSFAARQLVSAPANTRIADGMACSTPNPEALSLILAHVARIVRVTDEEVEAALGAYFSDTHNVAEGAAAAALAAVLRETHAGRRIGVVFTGGNIDAPTFARVLGRA